MIDFKFGLTPGDMPYDIETYPDTFTFAAEHVETDREWFFEISPRRNDLPQLMKFMDQCRTMKTRGVGFNSIGFDYPVMHFMYNHQLSGMGVIDIYNKAMSIIKGPYNERFSHMVWESDWVFDQLDLFKVHHYDNPSKSVSLKALEFAMRMASVEDLPFDVGIFLDDFQRDVLGKYNKHDKVATRKFYHASEDEIALRTRLTESFGVNMMNMSDSKIGDTIMIQGLTDAGVECFEWVGRKKTKKQTIRHSIDLNEAILPYVSLEHPEFQRIEAYIRAQVITETKGALTGLDCTINGVTYKFGTGGLHASIEADIVYSNDTHQIVDVDVASFYPQNAIKNGLYPVHLGPAFCPVYEGIYQTRKTYPKGTGENNAYKLALNSVYGNSNNKYSVFFDSLYTMTITISGQLALCMLIEQLIKVPGLSMIQANTDGVTYLCPREHLEFTREICRWWEGETSLVLEEALYSRMFIRDVNNYIAEYEGGKLKRIGAYAHETPRENKGTREVPWHKNHSSLVIAKAAEAALVRGEDIRTFITGHDDIMDFMMLCKVPRSNILTWGDEVIANVVRYYVSTDGHMLAKTMPAKGKVGEYKRANKISNDFYDAVLAEIGEGVWDARIHTKNKSKYDQRPGNFHTGYTVQLANKIPEHIMVPECQADLIDQEGFFPDINYEWYITQAEKLVLPLTEVE